MNKITLTLSQALNRALSSYKSGNLVQAEQLCQQITSAKQDVFDAIHLLAFVQSKLGKKEAALRNYDRAVALQPTNSEALNNRGNTLKQLNRFDEAIASYDRALAVNPLYAEALNNRGNALQELKRYDEAVKSYGHAVAVRPDYPEALNNRGHALHHLRRFDEAVESYDRALDLRPDYVEALNNRGNALQELKAARSWCDRITPKPTTMKHCVGFWLVTSILAGRNTNGAGTATGCAARNRSSLDHCGWANKIYQVKQSYYIPNRATATPYNSAVTFQW
jgi:tetratricopeptide (TPR) repeat protein